MSPSQPMDSLAIRGFRGLEALTLEDLGRFNLLLGANDVGKTSVLEAVFLLSTHASYISAATINVSGGLLFY